MIRVLHSVSYMHRAGVETFLMNYFRHINRSLIQFDFLCNKELPGDYDEEIRNLGGRIFYRPGPNFIKEPDYASFWKTFLANHPEIQIIHAHNGAKQFYPIQGAKEGKLPVRIAHAHSTEFVHDEKYKHRIKLIKRLPEVATHYFGCSNMAGQFFFGNHIWKKEGVLIRNAIPCAEFTWDPKIRSRIHKSLGISQCFVIGHVGRFQEQKNHSRLLDIFYAVYQKNKQARLLLVGTGKLVNQIMYKVQKMGLKDVVLFAGDQSDMSKWYQAMDIYVMPSLFEGLTLSGIEAQAAGLPCIFSDVVSTETKMTDAVRFISLERGNQDWAEMILSFTEYIRRNTQDQIVAAGYDIRKEVIRLEEIYMRIVRDSNEV